MPITVRSSRNFQGSYRFLPCSMMPSESPSFPRRTMHACSQCRGRKQKCGGPTSRIKCAVCHRRQVPCSFEQEAHDPRFAPYWRISLMGDSADDVSELQQVQQRPLEQHNALPHESPPTLKPQNVDHQGRQQSVWDTLNSSPTGLLQSASPQATIHRPSTPHPPAQPHSSSPQNGLAGPMRMLQDMGAGDAVEIENHHPVTRQILTMGEVQVCFRLFFSKCFANAPFLDSTYDSDPLSVQSRSVALLLNIVAVGARFWGQSSSTDTWLHPRYRKIIDLLDKEMSRLILFPRPSDTCLETIQAWMLYSHWMPIEVETVSMRSRFTESSVWQSLGLAIRWATGMGVDKSLPANSPTADSVRLFRTMAYLTESDHYLAISARCSPTLPTHDLVHSLPQFLNSRFHQTTDLRLAALLRTAHAAQVMDGRAASVESVDAFNFDVDEVERDFLSSATLDQDTMSQHFPFTSLRWYRLAFASTLLSTPGSWHTSPALRMSIAWASQILYHLSSSPNSQGPLPLDEDLASSLSFAIDQYFVVVAYAASFIVLAWREGAVNPQLQILETPCSLPASETSTLYRLVDLASRMLQRCSPVKGHLGSRYVSFLNGLASMLHAQDTIPTFPDLNQQWDQDWLNLWENSGLEQGWLFGNLDGNDE